MTLPRDVPCELPFAESPGFSATSTFSLSERTNDILSSFFVAQVRQMAVVVF
jgi:hypothetical protein